MEETVGVLLPSHVPHETEEHSLRIACLRKEFQRGTSWVWCGQNKHWNSISHLL